MPVKTRKDLGYFEEVKGKNVTLYTNLYFLAKIIKKLKAGYSPLVVIVGKQRIGKSFIANWLCYQMMTFFGKEYDPEKNTFYNPISAIESLGKMEKEPLLIDEAGSLLTKREWYAKSHIALDKIIQTQGYKTMMYVFVSPFASDIDKTFLKHFDFLLRVDDRGRFKAFQILKKYDEFKMEKATRRIFLDDVYLNKKALPIDLWEKYVSFSLKEKEKIRLETIRISRNKQEKQDDPFHRLKESGFL